MRANAVANERPVIPVDLRIDFRAQAAHGDWVGIPAEGRVRLELIDLRELGGSELPKHSPD